MNAQDLKSSILQLAIQGKLVEQREEEGAAKELLEQIKAAKDQLIKEKKIKKEKSLPEITDDEIPFDIPGNWEWVRLSSIIQVINGDRGKNYPSKAKLTDKGIPFISALNIENRTISKEKLLYMNEEQYKKLGSGKLKLGDVVLCIRGSLGKNGRYPFEKGAIASSLVILRSYFESDVYYEFIMQYINSGLFTKEIAKYNNGTAQPNLGARDLAKFIVPLPPLEEQKRIVAKIEELMPYVDKYDKAYSEVEELNRKFPDDMQKSILQYAIQGKLVEQREEEGTAEELYQQIQEEKKQLIKEGKIKKTKALPEITEGEIPFDIPESWKWVRLGELALYLDAGKSPNCVKQSVVSDEWGVITTTSIQCNFFDQSQNKILPSSFDVKEEMQVKTGDVLITRAGPTNRTGVACFVHDITFNLILSDKTVRVNLSDEYLDKQFISQAINSSPIRHYIIHMMSGMDKQQVNISQDKIRNIIIPLPPLNEQKRIVEKIKEILPYTKQLVK